MKHVGYMLIIFALLSVLILVQCGKDPLFGDMINGRIIGTVTDFDAGGLLSGVGVWLIPGSDTNRLNAEKTALTGSDGIFEFRYIEPGTYTVLVYSADYTPIVRTITLSEGTENNTAYKLQAYIFTDDFNDNSLNTAIWSTPSTYPNLSPLAAVSEMGGKLQIGPMTGRTYGNGICISFLTNFDWCQVTVTPSCDSGSVLGYLSFDVISNSYSGYPDRHIFGFHYASDSENYFFHGTNYGTNGMVMTNTNSFLPKHNGIPPVFLGVSNVISNNIRIIKMYTSVDGLTWNHQHSWTLYRDDAAGDDWIAFNLNIKGSAQSGTVNGYIRFDDFSIIKRENYSP